MLRRVVARHVPLEASVGLELHPIHVAVESDAANVRDVLAVSENRYFVHCDLFQVPAVGG